ncbi:hypothetical protein SAMN02745244_01225 [Tessaracoccus bendigoensis DSM 12906]|uniref:Uncharacterized protein n=1 Tax=Tessaracoccus bendigoensis DSM 12906 TaxID=1123357 RepID=A0A1M6EL42_9ACTN|nr:hypothetical protein [Tessaracoccus bendigoensis]SHI86173.1 hypothetical protein SAMN02745244_01225 [Tessaracoccus bendigoensis DSM 12906]
MPESTPDPRAVDTAPQPGRPIDLVPAPPGMWRMLLGAGFALLGPLFGFLIGSTMGVGDSVANLSPLQLALFGGFAVGGVGVLVAISGGWTMYVNSRRRDV